AMTSGYSLRSAGIEKDLAAQTMHIAAAVARSTDGVDNEVANVLATSYNTFQKRLKGSAVEKMSYLGDLFAFVQHEYQLENLGELAAAFKKSAAAVDAANVPLSDALVILGKLNPTMQGPEAGTNLKSALITMMANQQDVAGTDIIQRDKTGQLDIITTLRKLKRGMNRMGSLNDQSVFLTKLAGQPGFSTLMPLLSDIDNLEKELKKARDTAKGTVTTDTAEYLKLNQTRVIALKNSLEELAIAGGKAFGPMIEEWTPRLSKFASVISDATEKHPDILNTGAKAFAGLVGVKAGYNIGKLLLGGSGGAYTMAKRGVNWAKDYRAIKQAGGVLEDADGNKKTLTASMKVFSWATGSLKRGGKALIGGTGKAFQTTGKLFSKIITGAGTAGKALIAIMTGPHALLIAGVIAGAVIIGAAVYLIWKHWDWIKGKCSEIWGWMKGKWDAFCNASPNGAAVIKGAVDLVVSYYKGLWEALKKVWEWGQKAAKFLGFDGTDSALAAAKTANSFAGGGSRGGARNNAEPKALGGLISSPTFILAGEAGKEMYVPLENKSWGLQRLAEAAGYLGVSIAPKGGGLAERAKKLTSPRGEGQAQSSAQRPVYNITLSPNITIKGNADETVVTKVLAKSKQELKRMLEEIERDNRRACLA
ncbi:phage tail tape measure protein, partial [Cloacibacillus evryensis]|uniref:phage tail tape measure protein n=1 Tax=Cloacibacillus evryensis TaxID=508460 RepID=UPI002672397A